MQTLKNKILIKLIFIISILTIVSLNLFAEEKIEFKISLYENNSKESLKKKYRPFFNKLSNKEKTFVVLNAYFPQLMKLYKKSKDKNTA